MKRINLHAHSTFSDGVSTVATMAAKYKEKDFVCAVITDHDSSFAGYRLRETESAKLDHYFEAGKQAEKELNYPVIMGMEISALGGEEAVLFGESAIRVWMKERHLVKGKEINFSECAFLKEKHALIWVHPSSLSWLKHEIKLEEYCKHFHGYEIVNSGQSMFTNMDKLQYFESMMPNAKQVCGLDAHAIYLWFEDSGLSKAIIDRQGCVNRVDDSVIITNETELIDFIINSKQSDWKY